MAKPLYGIPTFPLTTKSALSKGNVSVLSICDGFCMSTEDVHSFGHLVPSDLGLAYAILVETNTFPGFAVIVPRTSQGYFSIFLYACAAYSSFGIRREKGRDLTQSCDKSPFTHRKIQKATRQHKTPPKILIT